MSIILKVISESPDNELTGIGISPLHLPRKNCLPAQLLLGPGLLGSPSAGQLTFSSTSLNT